MNLEMPVLLDDLNSTSIFAHHSARVVEQELRLIVDEQGSNVNQIIELVRENETLLDAMKQNLRESFVAEMARLILRSDTDGDMTVCLVHFA
jgi:predicted metallo-beta-lactamase superfamily hydrolase